MNVDRIFIFTHSHFFLQAIDYTSFDTEINLLTFSMTFIENISVHISTSLNTKVGTHKLKNKFHFIKKTYFSMSNNGVYRLSLIT